MFGRLTQKITAHRSLIAIYILLLASLVFFLYFWQLGNLTSGLSPAEVKAREASATLQTIANSPVYGPHKWLQFISQKVLGTTAFELRLVSAIFSVIFLLCFYHLIRSWFGRLVSLFASLLLMSTPWYVLLARSSGPEVLLLTPLAVICFYYWFIRSKTYWSWVGLIMASAVLIYVPGGIYLVAVGAVVTRRNIASSVKTLSVWPRVIAALMALGALAPLIYSVFRYPSAGKTLILIPEHWPGAIVFAKSIAWGVLALFWQLPLHLDTALGRLPMLNIAQAILVIFGGFALLRLARTKLYFLLGLVASGILYSGLTQNYLLLTFCLPAMFVLAAGGLRYLYLEWRHVFPRNPIPNYLAIGLIGLLVGLNILYGLRYVLHAWPNSAATRSTHVIK